MFRGALTFGLPVTLAMLAGPLGFAFSNAGTPDPANLYLVLGSNPVLDSLVAAPEAKEIGPYRAPFARIVEASEGFHSSLVDRGYWTFPATRLAELCGVRLGV